MKLRYLAAAFLSFTLAAHGAVTEFPNAGGITITDGINATPYPSTVNTPSQVQALNVGVPLIQQNPATGVFKLTIGAKKTTNLNVPFADFPMNAPGTSTLIVGAGKLAFQFTVPDNAAFFRLESQ